MLSKSIFVLILDCYCRLLSLECLSHKILSSILLHDFITKITKISNIIETRFDCDFTRSIIFAYPIKLNISTRKKKNSTKDVRCTIYKMSGRSLSVYKDTSASHEYLCALIKNGHEFCKLLLKRTQIVVQ